MATPAEAASPVPPVSVEPPGFASSASVTVFVADVTRFPALSRILTATVCVAPACALPGCVVMASCAGVPGVMLNVPEVAAVSAPLVARSV